jgi:hypothetical protein
MTGTVTMFADTSSEPPDFLDKLITVHRQQVLVDHALPPSLRHD